MMNYTEYREESFWMLDPDSDDIQNVLDMLNKEFRTFGDALLAIMQNKAGKPIEDPIAYLKVACQETGTPIGTIGSSGTLKNWFLGKPRPKKSDDSRRKMFALAFALNLSVSETQTLFHKAYLDRAFNQRDYKELIYYYCINHGLSFVEAESLINQVCLDGVSTNEATIFTQQIALDADKLVKTEELLSYIHSHAHNFSMSNHSARKQAEKLKARALKCAQEDAKQLQKQKKSAIASVREDAEMEWRENYHSKDIESDNFLYFCIVNQLTSGKKGTKTIPIANTNLPKEIKSNFPQAQSLALKMESFEELRKVIILLFSYEYWYQIQRDQIDTDEKYDQYTNQLDTLLLESNMAPLYYGNPYDWLFMYCTAAEHPLDMFQGILADVLDELEEM